MAYSYYQKYGNNNNNDSIIGIDKIDINKAKIRLRNGKKLTLGLDVFNNNNETLDVTCILAISLISIYTTHNDIKSPNKNDIKI